MVGTVSPKGRFTFGSGSHSAKSSVSGNKLELSESREEKLKRQVKTKADPTIAMYESTPSTYQLLFVLVVFEIALIILLTG